MRSVVGLSVVDSLVERLRLGYVLVDASLTIVMANDLIATFCQEKAWGYNGRLLTDLVPELIGVETLLQAIGQAAAPPLTLRQVQRTCDTSEPSYFDITVEPIAHPVATLLVIIGDVTIQAQQSQRLQQQRNDLDLLAAKLGAAREQLAYVIHRFVPTAVAQQIIEQQQLPLLGKTQCCEATLVFADMRQFTEVAEAFTPEQTLDILNQYLTVVINVLQHYQGSIVQIVGDMVMASFNVPQAQPDHADRAVAAAQAVVRALQQFAQEAPARGLPALGFGLGVCSGMVTAGYLGAAQGYRYAVVADATNVAYHLCARAAAGQILVADSTVRLLRNVDVVRVVGQVMLKRRREQIVCYEVCEALS